MRRLICILTLLAAVAARGDGAQTNGIIVKIGLDQPESLVKLQPSNVCIVHGLDTDADKVVKARKYLLSEGKCGTISVAQFNGTQLPYADNLVNRLVLPADSKIPSKEIERVLVPRGVAVDAQGKVTYTKPVPVAIDSWTHYLHGPDNNAVANDTVVGSPRSIQWVAGMKWGRSHEQLASLSALVSDAGRVIYIADQAPRVSIRYMPDWKLVARDAFNGTLLWTKNIGQWSDHLRHFRAGPLHLPRRLVAVDGKIYVTLAIDAPVSVIDAATGKTLRVLKDTERTEEITVVGKTIYLVVGTSEVHQQGAGDSFYRRGEPKPTKFRYIKAINLESGKQLWKQDFEAGNCLLPLSMTVRNGSLYYQDLKGVARLDAATGKQIWKQPRATPGRRYAFSAPTVVATDDVLLCADRTPKANSKDPATAAATDKVEWGIHGWNVKGYSRKGPSTLTAYAVETGTELWSMPVSEGYNSPVDVLVINNVVFVSKSWQGYDLKTGKKATEFKSMGGRPGMVHPRCYRNKASTNYLFTCRSGVEVVDVKKGWVGNNSWIRGTCQYGIMPANGLIYAPQDACGCFTQVKLTGLFAAAPAREKRANRDAGPRLIKGPAYGQPASLKTNAAMDWPMYRHDALRSGATKIELSATPKKQWSVKVCAPSTDITKSPLTQPVVVGDTIFVAEKDAHTVYALNAEDGSKKWVYTVGGRIDSAPTLYNGRLLFGSADGYVHCLRANDGKAVWTFRAAPEHMLVGSFGQLESAWPVHGSVLIQGGHVVFTAGRSTYLDGGLRFYRLDPATGKVIKETTISHIDAKSGEQTGKEPFGGFNMEGVTTDIMSGTGENVFIKYMRFDLDGKEVQGTKEPHLTSMAGLLEEEWFIRTYWYYGGSVWAGWSGWGRAGQTFPFGRILSFDKEKIYGYGRQAVSGGPVGHKLDSYHLFASNKIVTVQKIDDADAKDRRRGKKKRKSRPKKATPIWSNGNSLIVRAMVLAKDKIVVAGPIDVRKKSTELLAYDDDDMALASFRGDKGIMMRVVSAKDGKTLSEWKLDAVPAFDGMSAARGKVFIALKNGQLECYR